MLRFMGRWMGLSVRGFSLAVALALSIVVPNLSTRRGFAGEEPSQPPTREGNTPKKPKAERPPFDLTYVPPDAVGVIAIRPNAIFRDPAMKPLAQMADEALTEFLKLYEFPTERKLPIEEIEQIVGYFRSFPGGKFPGGVSPTGAGLVMIRATHDYDWRKLVLQIDPKIEEIHEKGLVYYKCHLKKARVPSSNAYFYCFIPDNRTFVLPPPGVFSKVENGKMGPRPHFSWDNEWKRVEHSLVAGAFDSRGNETSKPSKKHSGDEIGLFPSFSFTPKATAIVAEVDWMDGIDIHAFLTCKERAAAEQTKRDVKNFLTAMQFILQHSSSEQQEAISAAEHQTNTFQWQLQQDLFKHARVKRRENTVCVHSTAKINIADVVKMFQFEAAQGKKP